MLDIDTLDNLDSFRDLSPEAKSVIVEVLKQINDYNYENNLWKKGNRTFSTDKIKNIIMVDSWNFSPKDTVDAIKFCEYNFDSIKSLKTPTPSRRSVEDEFRQEFYRRLIDVKWTELDELAWKDIKYTIFDDKTLVIAPTGRGKEYKVIGQNAQEVYENLASIDRHDWIQKNVIKVLNGMIYGQKIVTLPELTGEKLSGAIAETLYKPKAVYDDQNAFVIGMTLTALKPITLKDYIRDSFEIFIDPINYIEIKNVISNDPIEPCFRFIDLNMKKGNCESWLNWMENTFENSNLTKEIFMAWIASVVVAKNNSKQVMYIHGFGNDGKSQMINALSLYLGSASVAIDKNSMNNQFGFSKLENKRFITISDNKNPEILRTGFIHKVTGGDVVDIERKGKNSYSAKMFGKILVCENIAPSINVDEINQVTRLIYIKCRKRTEQENVDLGIAKYDENGEYVFLGSEEFPKKLIAETEAFIAECLEVYKRLCPTDSAISIPKSYIEEVIKLNCGDITESFDIDLLNESFEIGSEDDYISEPDFWDEIVRIHNGDFNKKNPKETNNINKLVTTMFNVIKKQKRIDGKTTRILSGIKLKNKSQNIKSSNNDKYSKYKDIDNDDFLKQIMSD